MAEAHQRLDVAMLPATAPRTPSSAVPFGGGAYSAAARSVRPLLLPLGLAVVVVALALNHPGYPLVPWLLGIALGSFVLVFHSPAWALAPVVITELTLASYLVPSLGMSQRLVVTLGATALTSLAILRWGRLSDPLFRRVFFPSVALVVIATLVNMMFSQDEYVIKYLRYQVVQVAALVLAACLIRNRQDLLRIAYVALAVALVAAVAAVWQHYAKDSAPYGFATDQSVRNWKGRSLGFSNSPVTLANQMTFVLAPLLGLLLCGPWRRDRVRVLLGLALVVLAAGLNFSYTRSGVFALGPALIVMGLYLRGRRRLLVLGSVVVAILLFPALESTGLIGSRYYRDASEDQSAASHQALWEVSLAVALDHAVTGIGHEHFEEVALDYVGYVTSTSDAPDGASSIGQERPHNDFLSVWLSWGIFALLAYLGLFLGTLRNLLVAARHEDAVLRGLAVGCAGGLVTYAVSSAYHNYMDSSTTLWLYAGFSVALARLATGAGMSFQGVVAPRQR